MLAIRELYPLSEAHWRVPTLLFLSGTGMATGGWLAGYLYDMHGYYAPAFATGVAFNIANMALLFMLVVRQRMLRDVDARNKHPRAGCYPRRDLAVEVVLVRGTRRARSGRRPS